VKYIVAVSGGVDSVVLLNMLANGEFGMARDGLIVAHFDHGIRQESAGDAEFVGRLAARYGLPFEMKREELGPNASEELARDRRYEFLRELAKKYGAKIITAHHADDVIETIAINSIRGTGWRGLAVLDSPDIWRPLLAYEKSSLYDYARHHHLEWREDATNSDTKYLRNEVRQKLAVMSPEAKEMLLNYHTRQLFLRKEVDTEIQKLLQVQPYSRYFLIMLPHSVAIEVLRAILVQQTGVSPVRPQLERIIVAIKTMVSDKQYVISQEASLRFTKTHFVVEQRAQMLS